MPVPLVVAGVVAGFQMFSGLKQAEDVRSAARFNKELAEMNAGFIEMDAWEAEKYGFTQSTRYQSVIDDVISDQRVGMAARGVDVSFGSAKEVQEASKLSGFLNQLDMIQQAQNQSKNLKNQALSVRFGATMDGIAADSKSRGAENAGYLAAANTMASAYSGYAKPGTINRSANRVQGATGDFVRDPYGSMG